MRLARNKKAISPLIASVLLIVVVVGIGAVVTGIVRNYVTENKQVITEKASDMRCGTEIMMEVPVVAEEMRICVENNASGSFVVFTLENSGSATIDDLQVKFFGTGGFEADDTVITDIPALVNGFVVGSTYEFGVKFNSTGAIGNELQEVKLIPRVKVVGRSDKAYCTDSGLTFADLNECT
jgi:FlaG/FlaF family flagellin (archaellin)